MLRTLTHQRLALAASGLAYAAASYSDPQTRLKHHWQHRIAKELQIRCEVEEGDLDPVAAGLLEPNQLLDHMFRAPDDLDIAAKGTMRIAMRLPGNGVA